MTTIKEVAARAGVSQATVSRVLNGNPRVSAVNRQRVEAAIQELGYRPNTLAKSLVTRRTHSAGMIVGSLGGPFYGDIMHEAERVLSRAGIHLIVTAGNDHLEEERSAVEFLLERRCDCLILHVNELPDHELARLAQDGPPLIIINRLLPEHAAHCIWLDNEKGAYLATRHLLERGHRHIACIAGPADKCDSNERIAGYRRALHDFGVTYRPEWLVHGHFAENGGYEAARVLLSRQSDITAAFCANDFIAVSAMEAFREAGLSVPDDISVVGFDDVMFTRHVMPRLTTIHFPVREMGRRAGLLALHLMGMAEGEAASGRLQPELVVRASTRSLG
ncbi:MAG: LacI family transcriptional regulator [Gammaproteobacteria bacterium]|nr:MAG: LacI family transcriptional regulator [Gammaproteobacteria bacterium]